MIRIKCPCYGCGGRSVGCHSSCEEYKSYSAQVAAARETVFAAKKQENMLDDLKKEAIHRVYSHKRNHHGTK